MDDLFPELLSERKINPNSNRLNISNKLLEIYKKPIKFRSSKNIEFLYQECKNNVAFTEIRKQYKKGDLMCKEILARIEFYIYPAGRIIYSPGDPITNMLFLFEGKINVYKKNYIFRSNTKSLSIKVNNLNQKLNNSSKNVDPRNNLCKTREQIIKNNDDNERKNNNNIVTYSSEKQIIKPGFKRRVDRSKTSKKIVFQLDNMKKDVNNNLDFIIEKGESYGESTIKNDLRKALVEANTKCVVGFLSTTDYSLVFENIDLLEKHDIINFMKKIYIFKDSYTQMILNDIFENSKIKKLNIGQFLFKKGDPAKNLYIIREGSFKLFFDSKITVSTDYDLSVFDIKPNFDPVKTNNFKYELKKFYIDKNDYNMISIGEGDLIGDVEYYLNKKKYIFYARCETETAKVVEIDYSLFNQSVIYPIKEKLKKNAENKVDFYKKRYKIIKSVNKKKIDKRNKYKELIIDKLNKQNEEVFTKMEKDKTKKSINYKNLKKIFFSRPKVKILNEDLKNDMKSSKYIIQLSQIFNSTKYSINNTKSTTIPNLSFWKNKKLFLDNEKLKNEDYRNKRSVLTERNKNNFCNCFEINKKFYIKNNTSILKNELNNIFMYQNN